MAWSAVPTDYMADWSSDETDITLPIASLPELTAAEADPVSGDIRDIMYAFINQWYAVWNALPTADRSNKLTLNKTMSGTSTGLIQHQYIFTFLLAPTGLNVAPEA